MDDQAIYCVNNRLAYQFESAHINSRDFKHLQEEATYNVPGLVGMSHILNNTGAAYLMTGNPDDAIDFFDKALNYARGQGRGVQKAAILCNRLIAKSYCYEIIPENEFRKTMNYIFDIMGFEKLPFIASRLALNLISIAFKQDTDLALELMHNYPINELIIKGTKSNIIGSAQLKLQIQFLEKQYPRFGLDTSKLFLPGTDNVSGIQKKYIL